MKFGDSRLPARFWAKVEVDDPDDETSCWLWTAYCDDDGYGRFNVTRSGDIEGVEPPRNGDGKRVRSKSVRAHRLTYALANGLDVWTGLRGLDIHHVRCRERGCCRPDHASEIDHQVHGYYHGKTRGYVESNCSGTEWCLCVGCCEEKEGEEVESSEVPF